MERRCRVHEREVDGLSTAVQSTLKAVTQTKGIVESLPLGLLETSIYTSEDGESSFLSNSHVCVLFNL